MASVRASIEDEVVRLLDDLRATGVQAIRPYNGELAAPTSEQVLMHLCGQVPGILVAAEDGVFHGVSVTKRVYREDIEVVLYIVSGHLGSHEARTRESGQIFELLDATLKRLIWAKPNLAPAAPVGYFVPISQMVLGHDDRACVWKQMWRITVEAEMGEVPALAVTDSDGAINLPGDLGEPTVPVVRVSNLFG